MRKLPVLRWAARLDVVNITATAAVGHVELSHRGWRVNVKL